MLHISSDDKKIGRLCHDICRKMRHWQNFVTRTAAIFLNGDVGRLADKTPEASHLGKHEKVVQSAHDLTFTLNYHAACTPAAHGHDEGAMAQFVAPRLFSTFGTAQESCSTTRSALMPYTGKVGTPKSGIGRPLLLA